MLEQAKKRDHRLIGKQMKLFMADEEIGSGVNIFLPAGGQLKYKLEDFSRREHLKRDYEIIFGPQIMKKDVWCTSGHAVYYKENMFFTSIEEQEYALKPMNCVAHVKAYKSETRSYRDLPIRYFELGTVNRAERSGVVHGIMRTRNFTQDDSHVFCKEDQVVEEVSKMMNFNNYIMELFDFEYSVKVATKPEVSIGSDEIWEKSTNKLIEVCKNMNLAYEIFEGEGAFYGPKIEIHLKDTIGRNWQMGTIQIDFNLPERFNLSYVGSDNQKHIPCLIHKALFGSLERFMGVLIEHYAGAFPIWLAPEQVRVMNIVDDAEGMVNEIYERLKMEGFSVSKDTDNEKLGYKVRKMQLMRVPHGIIIGKKEVESGSLSVRARDGNNYTTNLEEYIKMLKWLVENRSPELWRLK